MTMPAMTPPPAPPRARPLSFEEWKAAGKPTGAPDQRERRSLEEIFGDERPAAPKETPGHLSGIAGQLAQGVTFGAMAPIAGAAGTVVRKIQGDGRPIGDIYTQLRDDYRGHDDTYRDAYPKTAFAANIVGGVASPASSALNAVRVSSKAGMLAKAANAGTQGALAGAVGGAANADDGKVLGGAVGGAALGGMLGGGFSVFTDAMRQGMRVVGAGPRAAGDPSVIGRMRSAVGAETAEESAARRVLRLGEQTGRTVDDLRNASAQADDPTILAELYGPKGAQRLRTVRSLGNTAREQVDETLNDRASNETARLRARFGELTGVEQRDAGDVAKGAMAKTEPDYSMRYKLANEIALPEDAARAVADIISPLDVDGLNISGMARKLGNMPQTLTAKPKDPAGPGAVAESAVEGVRRAYQEASERAAMLESMEGLVNQVDADGLRTRSTNMTPAMRRKNTMAKKRPTDEVLSRGEKRELGMDLTEDARARIEEAGMSVEEYRALVREGRDAQRRLPALEQRLQQAQGAADRVAPNDAPPLPSTLGQVLNYRNVLDALIEDNQATSYGRKLNVRLVQARNALDAIAKSGGGDREGAQLVQEADELFASAKAVGESFAGGIRAAQSGAGPTAARIVREQPNQEMARQGVASDFLRRLGNVNDEGRISNPVPTMVGGQNRRDVARMAFPDDDSFGQFRESARDVVKRLGTLRTATGGSQTSDNAIDALSEFIDPSTVSAAMGGSPLGFLSRIAQNGAVRKVFDANAREADAMAPLLLAGGPEQLPRKDALEMLAKMEPFIRARLAAQANRAGVVGGTTSSYLNRR